MAVREETIRVEGLAELVRDFRRIDNDLKKELNRELREAGQIVSDDARSRFMAISRRSAMGIRPRVRGRGTVEVEQRRRRVTGKRPDFGALQMRRAFLPALGAKGGEVERRLEQMLDRIGRRNDL